MDVSIIVAVGRYDFKGCLESLISQQTGLKYEVIAVGEAWMKSPLSNVKWITVNDKNPALKRNVGAHHAQGRILAFIDDDAYAPSDWLQKIYQAFHDNPFCAGVGGPNFAPPDSGEKERLADAVLSSRLGSGSSSYTSEGEEHDVRIGEIHLVNFAIRKGIFDELGGFNEALGYGAEDSEFIYLAKRLQNARFRYLPRMFVYHRRRKFGADFLKQRFNLRKQNGRILWVRPAMYMSNPLFCAGLLGIFLSLPLLLLKPWVVLLMFFTYLITLVNSSVKVKGANMLQWLVATILTHIVSVAGIIVGFLSIPDVKNYARLARRPLW